MKDVNANFPATLSPIEVNAKKLEEHGIHLPANLTNSTVSRPYEFQLMVPIEIFSYDKVQKYNVIIPEGLGIAFDRATGMLRGVPSEAGEFEVLFRYWLKREPPDYKYCFERKFRFIVNPDPKSLWKDLPIDPNAPYYKENIDKCSLNLSFGKKLVAASRRGRSHAHEGRFRDDHFLIKEISDGGCIIAVADGAGSAIYSRKGSEIACRIVIEEVEANITSFAEKVDITSDAKDEKKIKDALYDILGKAAFSAYKKIEEEAKQEGCSVKDYATTLLVSYIKETTSGWLITAFWVGDGGLAVYNKDENSVTILGEPDGGEFAGQTRFLTSPEIWDSKQIYSRIRYTMVQNFTSVVAMTDGVTDPKFDSERNLNSVECWNRFWNELSEKVPFGSEDVSEYLLEWLDFWSQGNHDDRTIAILY